MQSNSGKNSTKFQVYSDYICELLPKFDPVFRYALPLRVTGGGNVFTLLAVWAMHNKENYAARYIGQVWGAIQHYAHLLGGPIIIAGDFNSNKIWDCKKRTAIILMWCASWRRIIN